MGEECRVLRVKVADLERRHQTLRQELTSEIDVLKVWKYLYQSLKDTFTLQSVLSPCGTCPRHSWRGSGPVTELHVYTGMVQSMALCPSRPRQLVT